MASIVLLKILNPVSGFLDIDSTAFDSGNRARCGTLNFQEDRSTLNHETGETTPGRYRRSAVSANASTDGYGALSGTVSFHTACVSVLCSCMDFAPFSRKALSVNSQLIIDGGTEHFIDFDFWFVINQNRVENATIDKVRRYLQLTETASKQQITGIVNNTHLGDETTAEVILRGDEFAMKVAKTVNLPLIYTVGERHFEEGLKGRLNGSFFPIDRYMTKPWEMNDHEGGQCVWQQEE
jgi:hypothetical protein